MSWFDEQIKQRERYDDELLQDSFVNLARSVLGTKFSSNIKNNRMITQNAIDEILKFYHIKKGEIPDSITEINEQLEYSMRPHGFMRRTVILSDGWYKDCIGAILAVNKENGEITALLPNNMSGYYYVDSKNGAKVCLNAKTSALFEREAFCFYKPLPNRKIGIRELICYMLETFSAVDVGLFVFASFVITLIGLLTPKLNQLLYSLVIPNENLRVLFAIFVFMICVSVSGLILTSAKNLLMAKISTKIDVAVQSAIIMRILSLPSSFFKKYNAGDLYARSQYMSQLTTLIMSSLFSVLLTSLFSLMYMIQIFRYTPSMVNPALCIILITFFFSIISAKIQMGITEKTMQVSLKESGMNYAVISGIQKIKLAGAEKRAFTRWGNLYAENIKLLYNPPLFIKLNPVISTAISLIGTIVLYYSAYKSNTSIADYFAFHVSYGMLSGAFVSLSGIALTVAQVKPIMDLAKPILDSVPEISDDKQMVTRLSGSIELNNISFQYNETMPLVIDNLSLKVRSGQYVAIVGETGCGKSTLLRLMLGFETPKTGAVYYDGKDVLKLDLKSLRRKIGVVMQEGKLFLGDIFSNIVISAPWLTLDDAWKAAELADIAEDIRNMPMGMNTMIAEGSGGISGGQKQRLMIARAIAPSPKILMFDEATSALDNLTQKKVSQSLDSLKCTRIVIAHRLSTIKQCDRIIVLNQGKIIEDGTYSELMNKNGFFAELVSRQQIEN